jgi:hypothetical protein
MEVITNNKTHVSLNIAYGVLYKILTGVIVKKTIGYGNKVICQVIVRWSEI